MAPLPETPKPTIDAIYKIYEQDEGEHRRLVAKTTYEMYYEARDEGGRGHLGTSRIGEKCERKLWYDFRKALPPEFPGRIKRLFQTGHLEEARIVADLKAIGVSYYMVDSEGNQFGFKTLGGHFAGSCDGVAKGLLEAPKTPHLVEIKTANTNQFNKTKSKGVELAKPVYFAQMQMYMYFLRLKRAAFFMVHKDTDEIYYERINFDKKVASELIGKAQRVIHATHPPNKINTSPASWDCKYCDYLQTCHFMKAPAANCRTCVYSTPECFDGGEKVWTCSFYNREIDDENIDCKYHLYIPLLLRNIWGQQVDYSKEAHWIEYERGTNGLIGKLSKEIENEYK